MNNKVTTNMFKNLSVFGPNTINNIFLLYLIIYFMFINILGALTLKPIEFYGRSWELYGTASFDIFESWGDNILIESRGNNIIRILPRTKQMRWLTDRSRFAIDGLKTQRIFSNWLLVFDKTNYSTYIKSDWGSCFNTILFLFFNNIFDSTILVVNFGNLVDCETLISFKSVFFKLSNVFITSFTNNNFFSFDFREFFWFNKKIRYLKKFELVFFIGVNLRYEFPLSIGFLRSKKYITKNLISNYNLYTVRPKTITINHIFSISFCSNNLSLLNKNFTFFCGTINQVFYFMKGRLFLCRLFLKLNFIGFFISSRSLNNSIISFQSIFVRLKFFWLFNFNKVNISINYFKDNFNINNSFELGYTNLVNNCYFSKLQNIINEKNNNLLKNSVIGYYSIDNNNLYSSLLKIKFDFWIYNGFLGYIKNDKNFRPDIILPNINYYEKSSTYFDIEGTLLKSEFILTPSRVCLVDWYIFSIIQIYQKYYQNLYIDFDIFNYSKNSLVKFWEFLDQNENNLDVFSDLNTNNTILNKFNIYNKIFFNKDNLNFYYYENRNCKDIISFNSLTLNSISNKIDNNFEF